MNDLKKSSADAKAQIVAALTEKGVSVSGDATWAQIVEAIQSMTLDVKHKVEVRGGASSHTATAFNGYVRLTVDGKQLWQGIWSTNNQSDWTSYSTNV